MASLRKFPRSPFWFACFTLPDGRRVQRSTKEAKRKPAQEKADSWGQLAKERANARQSQKVISDIYRAAHKQELPDATPRAFITGWLARRKGEIAPASYASYSGRSQHFLEWLAAGADRPLAELETRQWIACRDALAARLSPTTANQGIKILRVIFEDARRDGYMAENPAKDCGGIELLAAAGLIEKRTHAAAKDGRAARRIYSELSFHSLRHTATSMMKNAGISPAIVQDIIGHDSAEMSAHYTHIEGDAKRKAFSAMPDIGKTAGRAKKAVR